MASDPDDGGRPPNLQLSPFPPELKRRFKAIAAIEDMTMAEAGTDAIADWCAKHEREGAGNASS
jgi:hypothetical protein